MKWWKQAGIVGCIGASVLVGCEAQRPELETAAVEPTAEASAAITSDMTCPTTRWVGRINMSLQPAPTLCPPAPGWNVSRLFAGVSPSPIPGSLNNFCLYEWPNQGLPDSTALGALPHPGSGQPLKTLDRDCMVVAPLSDASDAVTALRPKLQQSFDAQVEIPSIYPSPPPNAVVAPVRVALLDSWPNGSVGNLDHGFGMAAIIHRLACGAAAPGQCFASFAPHLALNLIAPQTRDNVNGGYYGFQSHFAKTVYEAVQAWKASEPNSRLVINASVGWEGRYNDDESGRLMEPVSAALEAIKYATCEGALVIASAGNTTGGPDTNPGPLFPAAWEVLPAPACVGPITRQLLWAVGGVDGRDYPIPNSRPGGRPLLAAPSYSVPAVMDMGVGPVHAGPYTGTSVSAAVASGIAAAVWHLNGNKAPHEIMSILRSSSVNTGETADFCLGGGCGAIGRLSLCRALETAVSGTLPCTKIAAGTGVNPVLSNPEFAAVDTLVTRRSDGSFLDSPAWPLECSSVVLRSSGPSNFPGLSPCASETLPNMLRAPAVSPQPIIDPCPACIASVLKGQETILELSINEELPGLAYAQTVAFVNRDRTVTARYDLTSARDEFTGQPLGYGLERGRVYSVNLGMNSALEYETNFDNVVVEWLVSSEMQATSFLLVKEGL